MVHTTILLGNIPGGSISFPAIILNRIKVISVYWTCVQCSKYIAFKDLHLQYVNIQPMQMFICAHKCGPNDFTSLGKVNKKSI